jgi:hypothetical protein
MVTYRDWQFIVNPLGNGWSLQVSFTDIDSDTGQPALIKGRKHYISPYMIPDEVVKTCYVAVQAATQHELMENFKLNGVAPFHPHNNVFEMLDIEKCHREEIIPEKL